MNKFLTTCVAFPFFAVSASLFAQDYIAPGSFLAPGTSLGGSSKWFIETTHGYPWCKE